MKDVYGVYTALITPFDRKGKLDEKGFRQNIQMQIRSGVDGIVPLGTTGESPTLNEQEKEMVIRIAIEEADGKIPVMVGTGSYSTEQAIKQTKLAHKWGANFVLVVTPYYNRPTQEGLFQHFSAVCNEVDIPLMLYNIQSRTGTNISIDTLNRLAEIPNIIGVKEASGNISQISDVIERTRDKAYFSVMSGDDALTLPVMTLGGNGVISVISNIIPKAVKSLVMAISSGNYLLAKQIHYQLMPFVRSAFIETNPAPIKAAMNFLGHAAGNCRLPLCALSAENKAKLEQTLNDYLMDDMDFMDGMDFMDDCKRHFIRPKAWNCDSPGQRPG